MRVLALDYGERRVGVAVSDPLGILAQPLETLDRGRAGGSGHLRRIDELVSEYEVQQIVIGLPLHLDGRHGPEADAAQAFGREVAKRTGVPVDYIDERWTSLEARRVLEEAGAPRRQRGHGQVDRVAAAIILRVFLERNSP